MLDTIHRSHEDRFRINVDEPHEVRCGTERLRRSEGQQRKAMARAGTSAANVSPAPGRA